MPWALLPHACSPQCSPPHKPSFHPPPKNHSLARRSDPPEDFAPFELADGLFYTHALENGAFTPEWAVLSARNVALLVAQGAGARPRHALPASPLFPAQAAMAR